MVCLFGAQAPPNASAFLGYSLHKQRRPVGLAKTKVFVGASKQRNGYGALAQLGERLLCKHQVIGSIPIGSTIC